MPYEKSSPSSPEAQSASPIQDNLKALAALFPSVVRDGQVDVDALRQLCGEAVVKEDELFGLNWRGKAEARRASLTPSLGTLRPCKEESKDWDTTQNLYIEGDNLEVLKLLRKSYGGKVKMIYIDPPYNTGKEFVYPDDYQNGIENYKKLTGQEGKYAANVETSGRYHTDWLNMMYPRLKIAHELLIEDGVIFISIDDHEVDNLKTICDEIFGASNFIANLVWKSKSGGANDSKYLAIDHEYILCYSKNFGKTQQFLDSNATVTTSYNLSDEKGEYSLDRLDKQSLGYIESLDFPIIGPDGKEYVVEHKNPNVKIARWRWSKDTVEARYDELVFKNGYVYTKNYKKESNIARSLLIDERFGRTRTGKTDFTSLFDAAYFSAPKPIKLINYLAHIIQDKNSIILDFFSGSASTAHAVMQLNAEDDGNRRFIMVQLPEPCEEKSEAYKAGYKTICEIGKERIRRAGEKVKEEAGLAGQNLDIGFRVYKLDSSNVKAWNPQAEDLATAVNNYAEHLVGGRTEDDFLTEIMLKSGIDLTEKVAEREIAGHRVQSLGYGQYYACMATDLANDAEEVALGIAAWHEEDCAFAGGEQQDTCTVFVADRAFESNDAAKMNFVAILEQHGICNIKAL